MLDENDRRADHCLG